MGCPDKIAGIILRLLEDGIISARFAAWQDDAKRASIEADHIHNLPHLLREYNAESLKWYWEAQRVTYVEEMTKHFGEEPTHFQRYWAELEPLVPHD